MVQPLPPPPLSKEPELTKWLFLLWRRVTGAEVLLDAVDDAAAEAAGVPLNSYYRTGSVVKVRVV